MTNLDEAALQQEVTSEQWTELKQLFGATRTRAELLEADHRRPAYARLLPHGQTLTQACAECSRDHQRELCWDKRKERLVNEFVDELAWLRIKGYKTMRRAYVRVHVPMPDMTSTETFDPVIRFEWVDDARRGPVESIRRIDIVVDGDRWTVWDDGVEDLNPWERDKMPNSSRASKGMYDEKFNT